MRRALPLTAAVGFTAVAAVLAPVVVVAALAGAPPSASGSPSGPLSSGSGPALSPAQVNAAQAAAAACPGLPEPVVTAEEVLATLHSATTPAAPMPDVAALCAAGAGRPGGLAAAVSAGTPDRATARAVLALAVALDTWPGLTARAAAAVSFAARAMGTPYRWGGNGPDGYDCSGLVRAAWAAGGVAVPRVAQDQWDAGPSVPAGLPALPGDLVFFGSGPADVTHVGLYVGSGLMIDAPHTGAVVRADPASGPTVVGVTRPG